MAAAGYPNGLKLDFLVRDLAEFEAMGGSVAGHAQETLNIEANIRMVQISVWFDEAGGDFRSHYQAIVSTLLDPTDYFNAWYAKGARRKITQMVNKSFKTSCHRSIVNSTRPGARP